MRTIAMKGRISRDHRWNVSSVNLEDLRARVLDRAITMVVVMAP